MKDIFKKLKHNHGLMMLLCCGIPLIVLAGAVYFFGLSRSYMFWTVLLLCPLMHFFIMKDMHKKNSHDKENMSPTREINREKTMSNTKEVI